jgi:hypothetical protein
MHKIWLEVFFFFFLIKYWERGTTIKKIGKKKEKRKKWTPKLPTKDQKKKNHAENTNK